MATREASGAGADGGDSGASASSRRRSSRTNKGLWTATAEEGLWAARLQLAPADDEERCVCADRGCGLVLRCFWWGDGFFERPP